MEHGQRLLAAQYRLAQHYLDKLYVAERVYQQGNESVPHALAMFDREREQVERWQAWAAQHAPLDQQAATMCSAYAGACPDIFKLRLHPLEYLSWLEAALEAARRLGDRHAEAAHLLEMCETCELNLEYQRAFDLAQQALSIARQIDARSLVAQGLNVCGNASRHQGNFEEAQAYYEQGLALYQAIDDRKGMAGTLNTLGMLALLRADNAAAQDYLEQSLAYNREIRDQAMLAPCLNNLGFLAMRLGNYTAATDYLQQALALSRIKGDKLGISVILGNLGQIAYAQGDYPLALNYYEQGFILNRASGDRQREIGSLHGLGLVMMALGNLPGAQNYFEQCLAFRGTIEANTLLPLALCKLAFIYLSFHEEDRAYASLREALEIASGLPLAHIKLMVLVETARVWVLKGKAFLATAWLSLIENDTHPAARMTDVQRVVQATHAECATALSPEQFAAAWEEGKNLDVDTVMAGILNEL